MASIKEKLVKEAKIGIQHAKTARALKKEVDRLKTGDSMNDKKL